MRVINTKSKSNNENRYFQFVQQHLNRSAVNSMQRLTLLYTITVILVVARWCTNYQDDNDIKLRRRHIIISSSKNKKILSRSTRNPCRCFFFFLLLLYLYFTIDHLQTTIKHPICVWSICAQTESEKYQTNEI